MFSQDTAHIASLSQSIHQGTYSLSKAVHVLFSATVWVKEKQYFSLFCYILENAQVSFIKRLRKAPREQETKTELFHAFYGAFCATGKCT